MCVLMADDEATLLVVEDEPNILELLTTGLRFAGFRVITAGNGEEATGAALGAKPDLILMDIMLPDLDGFEVTRRLRAAGENVPVIFLTAKDAVEDRVEGLGIGADDYITKPFSLKEVVARVRAVLRRSAGTIGADSNRLRVLDLILDSDSHEVWRGSTPIHLSPTEFSLLAFLMESAGRVVSKSQILDEVWNYDFGGNGAIVESYISYLRRKVDFTEVNLIHTVRGVGYVLRGPTTTRSP